MIAKLSGIVDQILEDSIIIDVGGVGYQVFVTSKFAKQLEVGAQISVRIYHIFRQEMQFLCGFQSEEEMRVFKALLDVPGIGCPFDVINWRSCNSHCNSRFVDSLSSLGNWKENGRKNFAGVEG